MDVDVGVTEQERYKQLIWNTTDAQRRAAECRLRNIWLLSNALMVCVN